MADADTKVKITTAGSLGDNDLVRSSSRCGPPRHGCQDALRGRGPDYGTAWLARPSCIKETVASGGYDAAMIAARLTRLASIAMVLALSGCQALAGALDPGPHVRGAGDQPVHAGLGVHVAANTPYVVGDLIICLDEPGEATITAIESVQPEGSLFLDEFAVVPNDMERGLSGFEDSEKTIAERGIDTSAPVIVRSACPDFSLLPDPAREPQSVALLLQYRRGDDRSARNHGILLRYEAAGRKQVLLLDWEITLCGTAGSISRECAAGAPTPTPSA